MALATAYLSYWKMNLHDYGGLLQHVVLDVCEAYKRGMTAEEEDALRGQMVGFFSAVCQRVRNVAPLFRNECDEEEEAWVVQQANAGLSGVNTICAPPRLVKEASNG